MKIYYILLCIVAFILGMIGAAYNYKHLKTKEKDEEILFT